MKAEGTLCNAGGDEAVGVARGRVTEEVIRSFKRQTAEGNPLEAGDTEVPNAQEGTVLDIPSTTNSLPSHSRRTQDMVPGTESVEGQRGT